MMLHPNYPTEHEIDAWCACLLAKADALPMSASLLDAPSYSFALAVRHNTGNGYVAFASPGRDTFYGYWQPACSGGPAPLLIHLPGYGAEMSAHPELATAGFNVLHVNPRGYATPTGPDEEKQGDGRWPVLPDTVTSCGEHGYVDWLTDVVLAVRWACEQSCVQADRLGVFGTSQGGGTALLTASLLRDRGIKAVAADLPFMTNFPLMATAPVRGAYDIVNLPLADLPEDRRADAWRALGFVDTMSHAHRLAMPVLLTSGEVDETTPKESIFSLFQILPGTRSYTEFSRQGHAYTPVFIYLTQAWFGAYV